LFNLYSVIINADSAIIPDTVELFHEFVLTRLLLTIDGKPRNPNFLQYLNCSPQGKFYANFPRYFFFSILNESRNIDTNCICSDAVKLVQIVSSLCEELIPITQLQRSSTTPPQVKFGPPPRGVDTVNFGGFAAHLVVTYVKQMLESYPIVKKTTLLQRVFTHKQPIEYVLERQGNFGATQLINLTPM
jgi:hypothetical protein